MRIISGIYKGQIIDSPKGHKTHPMGERMRGALFNTLGDITGLSVLDAFAGSGALGIEALSRGASSIVFLDSEKAAYISIAQNIKKLHITNSKLTQANCASWSDHNFETKFDIVLADPPYDHIVPEQLAKLVRNVKNSGLYVLSLPKNYMRPGFEGFNIVGDKSYADGSLVFYKNHKI